MQYFVNQIILPFFQFLSNLSIDLFLLLIGFSKLIYLDFDGFLKSYNIIDATSTWLFFLIFCFLAVLIFLKLFGAVGLYIYTVIAIISGNIQILKLVKFSFFNEPVALGTALFASTFFCTDILSEYFGKKEAQKNVFLGFAGFLLMTFFMIFTIGFKPLDPLSVSSTYEWALKTQENLISIFLPFPTFFISSMLAYLTSQFFDVWFFEWISKLTNKRFLWLRNNLSTMTSSLIDNFIFSIFAWIIFNPNPLEFNTVLFTFILGTYILRIIIAIIDTPFLYLSRFFLPKNHARF
tara:strand:+ start:304 stop:1182 length:879 start_codon:yes stop_codon:yes gene_type:complete